MKIIITILFTLLLSAGAYAQEQEITAREKFKADLKSNNITLYVLGGFAPKTTREDLAFQTQFAVKYFDFGCVVPANLNYYREYNRLVFIYLKKRFANKWEKDIRKDVLDLDKWKPKPGMGFRSKANSTPE